jgi:hypothetical protein
MTEDDARLDVLYHDDPRRELQVVLRDATERVELLPSRTLRRLRRRGGLARGRVVE